MHYKQLFLSLFFCVTTTVTTVPAQQHIAYQAAPNNLIAQSHLAPFIVSAGITYAQGTIVNKAAQPFLRALKSGEWQQVRAECIHTLKEPTRFLCLGAAYLLLQHLSQKMVHCPPLYQNTSHAESLAAMCIPLAAAQATSMLIQQYFHRQQLLQQQNTSVQQQEEASAAANAPAQLTASRNRLLLTILTAIAVALVQYYTWFKVHDYFQPWVMPTQHDHMVQFTGYHLAPAACNLVFY